jgi:hypothetical protein
LLEDDKLEKLVNSVCDVVIIIANTVANRAADLVYAVGNLVLQLLKALGSWASENQTEISDAIRTFIDSVIHIIVGLFDGLGHKIFGDSWDEIKEDIVTIAEVWLGVTFIQWLMGWVTTVNGTLAPIHSFLSSILSLIGQVIAAHPILAATIGSLALLYNVLPSYNKTEDPDYLNHIDLKGYVDAVYADATQLTRDEITHELQQMAYDPEALRVENGILVGAFAEDWYKAHPEEYKRALEFSKSLSGVTYNPNGLMVYNGGEIGIKVGSKSVTQLQAENAAFQAKLAAYENFDVPEPKTPERIQLVQNIYGIDKREGLELYRKMKSFVGVVSTVQ